MQLPVTPRSLKENGTKGSKSKLLMSNYKKLTLTWGRMPGFSPVDNKVAARLHSWGTLSPECKDLGVNPTGVRADPLRCHGRARLDPRLSSSPGRCSPLDAVSRQLLITPKEIPEYHLELQTCFEWVAFIPFIITKGFILCRCVPAQRARAAAKRSQSHQ